MKIYNEDKTQILDCPDISMGYFREDVIGDEDILVYIPYTSEEAKRLNAPNRIEELKKLLADTDYKCMKHADGEISDEEYEEIKAQRHQWRLEIGEWEKYL